MQILILLDGNDVFLLRAATLASDRLGALIGSEPPVMEARKFGKTSVGAGPLYVLVGFDAGRGGPSRALEAAARRLAPLASGASCFVGAGPLIAASESAEAALSDLRETMIGPFERSTGLSFQSAVAVGGGEYRCGKVLYHNWDADYVSAWVEALVPLAARALGASP